MKAIIFDMGGVLVDLDPQACINAFKENLGFNEIETILDPCHQKGIIGDMEEGKATDEAFAKILSYINPVKIDLLKRLSAEYDIYLLSNNNPVALPFAERMFEEAGFPLYEGFKKCYISYQMKTIKPSEAFYKTVIADIGLPASEMLFVDDSQRNVDAAIAAGLPAVYYQPGTDLAALIDSKL